MNNTFPPLLSKNSAIAGTSRHTKIVATIGPSSESEETLRQLLDAGMNVARFNTKHVEPSWHLERIKRIRKVAKEMGKPVAILLDLQGPEIRIKLLNAKEFPLAQGETALLTSATTHENPRAIQVPQAVIESLSVGNQISFADGACEFEITAASKTELTITAQDTFVVATSKTMNTPGIVLNMPALTEKDLTYIEALKTEQIEFIGLSFVRDRADIDNLRKELDQRQMNSAIVAKIEHQGAIDNMQEVIEASEAVMVARGDLAVEVPFYEVPHWQKEIIKKCNELGKPVITATQMLLSMTTNRKPTRAEISDVANAVYDHTDAVMLSEESASGKHPVRVVETMAKIVAYHEQFV